MTSTGLAGGGAGVAGSLSEGFFTSFQKVLNWVSPLPGLEASQAQAYWAGTRALQAQRQLPAPGLTATFSRFRPVSMRLRRE